MGYLVSKCVVRKRQMCWIRCSTCQLLQTLVQVLNGDLLDMFERWFARNTAPAQANPREVA